MRKYIQNLLLTLAILGLPVAAFAQVDTKTISTSGANCTTATACAVFGVRDYPSIGLYLDVGTSGTFVFEATTSDDPTSGTWFAVTDDVGAAASATADGFLTFSNPGYSFIRLRASAISGNATVVASRGFTGLRSTATLSGGGGDGAIQDGVSAAIEATVRDYANSNPLAVAVTDATGDIITSFGGGTQYAVDAALGAAPTGTLSIAIRDDALSALTPVEGDAIGLRVDANGALWTTVSGTVTVGTHAVTGSGSFTVDSEMAAAVLMADNISLPTVPIVGAANLCYDGTNLDLCRASTTTEVTEDLPETASAVGGYWFTVRRDTAASSAGTTGDNATANTNAFGALWTISDLCGSDAVSSVAINATTSGNTELVALSGSTVIYVCGYNFMSSGASDVRLVRGTGAACATGETGLTGLYPLIAQTGISVPNGGAVQTKGTAGDAVCIESSAVVNVRGVMTYVQR